MDFTSVSPIIFIKIKEQIKLKVNWTQIYHLSLQKNTKMAISQNPLLTKCQSPYSSYIFGFVWNFQNRCKYGFCKYKSSRIFDLGQQKNLSSKSKKTTFFGFWVQIFFGDLNKNPPWLVFGHVHDKLGFFPFWLRYSEWAVISNLLNFS